MHLANLIGGKTGIIRACRPIRNLYNDPPFYCVYAEPAQTKPIFGVEGRNRGGACDVSLEGAMIRACGESIERYCSVFRDDELVGYLSSRELSDRGISYIVPNHVHRFSDEQFHKREFRFEKLAFDQNLNWIRGFRVKDNSDILVAASLVFVPYVFQRETEPFTHMPISSGMAAGPNMEFCLRKGVLELIERDALMIIWKKSYNPPRVVMIKGELSETLSRALWYADLVNAEWFFNVLTLDIPVPVLSAMLVNREGVPLTSFGISADSDPIQALDGAVREAMLSRFLLNRSKEVSGGDVWQDFRTLRGHLLGYATDRKLANYITGRFCEVGDEVTLTDIRDELPGSTELVETIEKAGCSVCAVDLTTDDVGELGTQVFKVIIPGLEPLDNDHSCRHLGGDRLRSAPAMHFRRSASNTAICEWPHPFP